MERELFDWNGWDIVDTMSFSFYNVKFHNDFGPFKAGIIYGSLIIDYGNAFIEAYDKDGLEVVAKANIKLSIAEQINLLNWQFKFHLNRKNNL